VHARRVVIITDHLGNRTGWRIKRGTYVLYAD